MLSFLEKPSERYSIAGLILLLVGMIACAMALAILAIYPLTRGFFYSLMNTNWMTIIIVFFSSIISMAIGRWCARKSVKLEQQEQQQELEAHTGGP